MNNAALKFETQDILVDEVLPHAPETIWKTLTSSIHCQVLEAVPNERLVYSWKGGHDGNVGYGSRLDTLVTWTLSEVEGGTRVRLAHSGFVLPTNATACRNLNEGWPKVVRNLGTVADGLR